MACAAAPESPEVVGRGRPLKVLEFRSVRGTGGGPEKTILLGAAAADRSRTSVTVCYLRDARDEVFHIDRRAEQIGIDYVELVERHSFDPSVVGALRHLVRAREIDIIHSHDYKTDAIAWLACRKKARLVATAHGWTGHSAREKYLYYPAGKRLLARFPMVIAVSTDIRHELVRHGARPDRVRVLLNGIDHTVFVRDRRAEQPARERYGFTRDHFVVGSVGRLEVQKRFDILMEACARVRRQFPQLRLVIAGDGGERRVLEQHIASHAYKDWCTLAGHLDDVPGFHHALDLFVQSSAYEGTPNVVLEAMALETPVVATNVGGTAEICREDIDGLIVAPGDDVILSEAIVSAIVDADGRQRRTRSARIRVEHELSFQARVRALDDLYAEMAG